MEGYCAADADWLVGVEHVQERVVLFFEFLEEVVHLAVV